MRKVGVAAIVVAAVSVVASGQVPLVAPAGALAFPSAAAGISAWVKVDRPIRIDETLANVFHRVVDVSASHILGTVEVKNFVGTVYPHVYVDTEGWIIAFFLATEPTAWIIHWQGDANNPVPSIRTTLEEALDKAAAGARVSRPKISFYDFQHPEANNMLILLSVLPAAGTKVMYVKLPATYTPHVVSYYHYGCNYHTGEYGGDRGFTSSFSLAGRVVSLFANEWNKLRQEAREIPSREFEVDTLYELKLEYTQSKGDNGSAGLALVLIYQAP